MIVAVGPDASGVPRLQVEIGSFVEADDLDPVPGSEADHAEAGVDEVAAAAVVAAAGDNDVVVASVADVVDGTDAGRIRLAEPA